MTQAQIEVLRATTGPTPVTRDTFDGRVLRHLIEKKLLKVMASGTLKITAAGKKALAA